MTTPQKHEPEHYYFITSEEGQLKWHKISYTWRELFRFHYDGEVVSEGSTLGEALENMLGTSEE